MSQKDIIVENLTIYLPNGWQGDSVYLARVVSEQIQQQAKQLHSAKQLEINLEGNYSGVAGRIKQPLASRLNDASTVNIESSDEGSQQQYTVGDRS